MYLRLGTCWTPRNTNNYLDLELHPYHLQVRIISPNCMSKHPSCLDIPLNYHFCNNIEYGTLPEYIDAWMEVLTTEHRNLSSSCVDRKAFDPQPGLSVS